MKYTGYLNYLGTVAFGAVGKLKAHHLMIYDALYTTYSKDCPKYLIDGKYYLMTSAEFIATDLPIMDIKPGQVRNLLADLEFFELIERPKKTNVGQRRLYIKPGRRSAEFNAHILKDKDRPVFDTGGYITVQDPDEPKPVDFTEFESSDYSPIIFKNDQQSTQVTPEPTPEPTVTANSQPDSIPEKPSKNQDPAEKNKKKPPITELDFSRFNNPARAKEAWEEWIQYRKDEKIKKYKTLGTEQTTINQRGSQFGYDSIRFHAAILNSIGQLYNGIYESKDFLKTMILEDCEMTENQLWSYNQFKMWIRKEHASFLEMPGGYLKYSEYLAIRQCTAKPYMAKWANVIPEFMKRWCTAIGLKSLNWEKRSFYELLIAEIEKEYETAH